MTFTSIPLVLNFHPTADAARQLRSGAWALIDSDGNSVDIVTEAELVEIVRADGEALAEQYAAEAPHVAAGIL